MRASDKRGMQPPLLRDALPSLFAELATAVESERPALLLQLEQLRMDSRCGCRKSDCATIFVSGAPSPLDAETAATRGRYSQDSVILDTPASDIVLSLDHLDRIVAIEIIGRPDLSAAMDTLTWLVPKST